LPAIRVEFSGMTTGDEGKKIRQLRFLASAVGTGSMAVGGVI
jgi:hypothetical protein